MAKKSRNIYDPLSQGPYKLSRTGLELFKDCPRCFYLDKRIGIGRPSGPPFNLNSAVDALLKKEFDQYRELREPHPLMKNYKISAIPFSHPDLEKWRTNFTGIQFHHKNTNLIIFGAVDDLWVNPAGELIVVDYKATAKEADILSLDQGWHVTYKRQLEVYQWLLKQNGFSVASTCYWVYANGDKSPERFDATLKFRMTVIPYQGNSDWVEKAIVAAKQCLNSDTAPPSNPQCNYCTYVQDIQEFVH